MFCNTFAVFCNISLLFQCFSENFGVRMDITCLGIYSTPLDSVVVGLYKGFTIWKFFSFLLCLEEANNTGKRECDNISSIDDFIAKL